MNSYDATELEAIRRQPKPLLHIHLEGSIPQRALTELATKNRVSLPYGGVSRLIAASCKRRDWLSFRNIFSALCSCLCEPSDFTTALLSLRTKLAREAIDYVEVHCTPWKHLQRGIALDALGDALTRAAEQGDGLPETKIIFDLTRNILEPVDEIASWLFGAPRKRFVGLGISGGPDALPRAQFAHVCRRAEQHGLGIVAHAGELEGADSVEDAVRYLGAHRIVHGASLLDNTGLAAGLAKMGLHLELCPTANLRLGVGDSHGLHLRRLLDHGFNVSVNTDDEFIFDTSLMKEISYLVSSGLFEIAQISTCIASARRAAFCTHL
jgi:aminodeoxyfutalosine deaminase